MNANMKSIREVLAVILLIVCLCISMVGCADIQDSTEPTDESVLIESSGNTTGTQIPEETDAMTEPNTEATTPSETETTPFETAHIHSYTSKVTAPTCTEGGYTTFICDCGDTYTDEQANAVGHNYSSAVKAATCTEKGYTTYTCNSCGDSYTADQTDATGHTYHEKVTSPTCTEKGYTTYICSACGDSYTGNETNATGHSWGSWKVTTEAKIGIPGKEERKCSSCQKVESRAIDALPEPTYQTFGHEIGVYEYDNVRYEMALANHFDYAAYIAIYTTGKDSAHETAIITAFTDHFGFSPTAKVKVETIGTYLVDSQVKTVYQYYIFDKTHPFLDHAPYEVYHQICTDGISHWVGFAILGSNDDDWDELMSEPTVRNLKKEMYRMFYEKTGYSADYIAQHKEDFCMGWISVAGEMRTADGEVVEVLYIYCREKEK